jgi:hypothetical protein
MIKALIILGIIICIVISVLVLALCKMSKISDEHADYLYYQIHRGDDNGDN